MSTLLILAMVATIIIVPPLLCISVMGYAKEEMLKK